MVLGDAVHRSRRERVAVVIPIKSLKQAKSRLKTVFPGRLRERLILCMLRDVITACRVAGVFYRWAVISADPVPGKVVADMDGIWLREAGRSLGLNKAIHQAVDWALSDGADALLVVSGDVPLARPEDFQQLVRRAADSKAEVVIVPEHGGNGTNALFQYPPGRIRACFGRNSRWRHRDAAEQVGASWLELPLSSLGRDVDTPEDVLRVARLLADLDANRAAGHFYRVGFHTYEFLKSIRHLDWPELQAALGGRNHG